MGINLNNIVFSGRLADDAQTRSTQSGRLVTGFRMFVTFRLSRDQQTGEWSEDGFWIDVEKWEPQNAQPRPIAKGEEVVVVGKIREHAWQDNEGRDRRSLRVVASEVRPVSKPKAQQGAEPQNGGYGYAPQSQQQRPAQNAGYGGYSAPPKSAPPPQPQSAPPMPAFPPPQPQSAPPMPAFQPPQPDVTDDDLPF